MSHEANILILSSENEESHEVDRTSERDLFEELKAWRREYARLDSFKNFIKKKLNSLIAVLTSFCYRFTHKLFNIFLKFILHDPSYYRL